MSLVRLHNPLSRALIRRLGDAGGPPADHVDEELNNLIAWASSALRNIYVNVPGAPVPGNVGTGLDTLDTFSLDTPNRLTSDRDYLRLHYSGQFTASVNTRRIVATFGGQSLTAMGKIFVAGANVGWTLDVVIARLSSTSVRVSSKILMNDLYVNGAAVPTTFGNAGFFEVFNTTLTGLSNLNSNAQSIVLQAEGNSDNDVTMNLALIELRQQ